MSLLREYYKRKGRKKTNLTKEFKMKKKQKTDPKMFFSKKSTKKTMGICNKMIKSEQARKQTIAFIRAADGKRIRNKSGV